MSGGRGLCGVRRERSDEYHVDIIFYLQKTKYMRDTICFRSTVHEDHRVRSEEENEAIRQAEQLMKRVASDITNYKGRGMYRLSPQQTSAIETYKELLIEFNPAVWISTEDFNRLLDALMNYKDESIKELDKMSSYLIQENVMQRVDFFRRLTLTGAGARSKYVSYHLSNDAINFLEFLTRPAEERSQAVKRQLEEYTAKIVPLQEVIEGGSRGWDYTTVMQLIATVGTSLTFQAMEKVLFNSTKIITHEDHKKIIEDHKTLALCSIYMEAFVMAARRTATSFFFEISLLPHDIVPRVSRCYDYFRESCTVMHGLFYESSTYEQTEVIIDLLNVDMTCFKLQSDRKFKLTYFFNKNLQYAAFYAAMTFLYADLLRFYTSGPLKDHPAHFALIGHIQFYARAFDTQFDSISAPLIQKPSGVKSNADTTSSAPQASSASSSDLPAPFIAPQKQKKHTSRVTTQPTETLMDRKYRERKEHLESRAKLMYERELKRNNTVIVTENDILANLNARIENALSYKPIDEPTTNVPTWYEYEECVICFAEGPSVVIHPCMHKCICVECSKVTLPACPVCQGPFSIQAS